MTASWEDSQPDRYPCGCDGTPHWHPRKPATQYLPSGCRCTAYWYAQRAGMLPYGGPPDQDDLDFLKELGLRAARLARWQGVPEWLVPEGPYPAVHTWPEQIWDAAADSMAQQAAERGEWYLSSSGYRATRVVHCQREPFDVYIGRPGPWGNPFIIGRDGDREQVIAMYETYLRSRADLMAAVPELRGKVLGCHCAPLPCHGDVLARLADSWHAGDRPEDPLHPHGYWEAGDYDDVLPPWCPLPQGDQALRAIGF